MHVATSAMCREGIWPGELQSSLWPVFLWGLEFKALGCDRGSFGANDEMVHLLSFLGWHLQGFCKGAVQGH